MTDTMPEPYAYLVVYDLGEGKASTFWSLDVSYSDDWVELHGYKGGSVRLSHATPYCVKEKARFETPNYVIAEVEECDVSEVEKGE